MRKNFKVVGIGGTFDELHRGHEALLNKAFELGKTVIIGITSDEFVQRLSKPHATEPYKHRLEELREFLKKHELLQRAKIIPIDDAYGGVLLSEDPIEALVVSKETEATAIKINEKRKEIGLHPLHIVAIEMVPSENHSPISTTRIRLGEIDREGHILKT